MATGNFPDLPRGAPLAKISAEHIRGWNVAARAERARGFLPLNPPKTEPKNSTIVKIQNKASEDLPQFSVVTLGNPVFNADDNLDEFKQNWCIKANAPSSPATKPVVAVTLDPLKEDAIGRATVLGVTPVQILVGSGETSWEWADVSAGETGHLVMAHYGGPARILWKQSGEGTKWALVLLGVGLRVPTTECP